MKNNRFAAIDIGTNTFRLFIAEVLLNPVTNNPALKKIYSERIITRLGEGILPDGLITEKAFKKGLDALIKFSNIISNSKVLKTSAIATSALREAGNSELFINTVRETTGIEINTVRGEDEARLAAAGMLIDMEAPSTALMIDIGGGSTELVLIKQGAPLHVKSMNLGVVYLASRFMKKDPPSKDDLDMMDQEIVDTASPFIEQLRKHFTDDTSLIGTAGTITTLSAIKQKLSAFDHGKIHNSRLDVNEVTDIYSKISGVDTKERAKYIPFDPARLDIIVPGTLILLKLMALSGFNYVTVSNHGLREGIILDLYKKSFL